MIHASSKVRGEGRGPEEAAALCNVFYDVFTLMEAKSQKSIGLIIKLSVSFLSNRLID